jgi:AhpD family alkylhydroperoxidase
MHTATLGERLTRSRDSARVRKRAAILLHQIERGACFNHRLLRRFISLASGMRFRGAARIALKKRPLLGTSLGAWTQSAMRGPSAWSIAERELMAAMAAQWNACAFCTDMLGAAAARHIGGATVDAVLSDYHSAPISDGLKATLEFLEIMTLRPRSVTEAHVNAVIESGISMETLIDAIEVGVVLKLISRYASALDFAAPTATGFAGHPSRWSSTGSGRDLPVL